MSARKTAVTGRMPAVETKNGHTPGPWHVHVDRVFCDNDKVIAEIFSTFRGSHEANARLIAAAPAMLDALKLAYSMLVDDETQNDPAVIEIRAAITKAMGAQP